MLIFIILLHCEYLQTQDIILSNGQKCDLYFDVNTISVQLKCVPVFTPAEYVLDNFSHKSCMKHTSPLQFDTSES